MLVHGVNKGYPVHQDLQDSRVTEDEMEMVVFLVSLVPKVTEVSKDVKDPRGLQDLPVLVMVAVFVVTDQRERKEMQATVVGMVSLEFPDKEVWMVPGEDRVCLVNLENKDVMVPRGIMENLDYLVCLDSREILVHQADQDQRVNLDLRVKLASPSQVDPVSRAGLASTGLQAAQDKRV